MADIGETRRRIAEGADEMPAAHIQATAEKIGELPLGEVLGHVKDLKASIVVFGFGVSEAIKDGRPVQQGVAAALATWYTTFAGTNSGSAQELLAQAAELESNHHGMYPTLEKGQAVKHKLMEMARLAIELDKVAKELASLHEEWHGGMAALGQHALRAQTTARDIADTM